MISLKRIAPLFALLCATLFWSAFSQAEVSSANNRLEQLQLEHRAALELSLNYPDRARRSHAKLAGQLEALVGQSDIDQGALAYNIGNSWFHAGRYGESVLWYRRAQEAGYQTPELEHNLNFVRQQRVDNLPALFGKEWFSKIYLLCNSTVWLIGCLAVYLLFWFSLWHFFRNGWKEPARLIPVSAALVVAASGLLFSHFYQSPFSDGVIIAADSVARKGPGLIFSPAFTSPLNQGTEFLLLEQQEQWWQVQLSNEDKVWLPANAVELVKG